MTDQPITRAIDDLNAGFRSGTLTKVDCPHCTRGCAYCSWEGVLYVSNERVYRARGSKPEKHYVVHDVSF